MHPLIPVWYKQNLLIIKSEKVWNFFSRQNKGINMTRQGARFALRHLPTLNNKRNYCIHNHLYLFVGVHVHLSIGLTVMHI